MCRKLCGFEDLPQWWHHGRHFEGLVPPDSKSWVMVSKSIDIKSAEHNGRLRNYIRKTATSVDLFRNGTAFDVLLFLFI